MKPHSAAAAPLTAYQREFLLCDAPRIVVVKARRIGFTWAAALRVALRAMGMSIGAEGVTYASHRGVPQRIISASQNQASAFLSEVNAHLEVLGLAVGESVVERKSETRIRLSSNDVEIHALAANPRTVRGAGADVVIDEAAALPEPEQLWQAVKATVDPTLARPGGYKLLVIGTPLGDDPNNLLYRFARGPLASTAQLLTVDIHRAIQDGFPADAEALRRECGSDIIFREEYGAEFLSSKLRLISEAAYDSCAYDGTLEFSGERQRYLGFDVARSATGDAAALVELLRDGQTLVVMSVTERYGVPWEEQEAWIATALQNASCLAIDATGLGSMLAERLTNRFGSRVLPISFGAATAKETVVTGLQLAFERRLIRVPRSDARLRRAVLSFRREITEHANVRYTLPRLRGEGHADSAIGLALAVHAAGGVTHEPYVGSGILSAKREHPLDIYAPGGARSLLKHW